MNTRCAVCGLEGAVDHQSEGGDHMGRAHVGECAVLVWEAYLLSKVAASEHEHAEVLWKWRKHRAEVAGETFAEPPPRSPVEFELDAHALALGVP